MKILIVNGPNLGALGRREPEIYGNLSLGDIENYTRRRAAAFAVDLSWRQSNHEGEIVDFIETLDSGDPEGSSSTPEPTPTPASLSTTPSRPSPPQKSRFTYRIRAKGKNFAK